MKKGQILYKCSEYFCDEKNRAIVEIDGCYFYCQ